MPYHVLGASPGAASLTSAWIRSAITRSDFVISAILASTSRSASSAFLAALSSAARSFIAAFSSALNPFLVFVSAIAQLLDADEVSRRVAERAVAQPVRLVDRLLHDLGVAGLQPLERAVEVG